MQTSKMNPIGYLFRWRSVAALLGGIVVAMVMVLFASSEQPRVQAAVQAGTPVAWGYNGVGLSTVPEGLTDVTAVSAGSDHNLALKSDGTVVAWGANQYGQSTVPEGLTDVTAVSAYGLHSLALKSDGTEDGNPNDGTVVAWGDNSGGQSTVPEGLTDVTAVDAGTWHNLALKSDGTVVTWGATNHGQLNVPAGLTDVTAVSAGHSHSLALKSDGTEDGNPNDGTVVAWGDNADGQLNVPAGLTDVTAVSAGGYHSLALKSDGTVVAWGTSGFGQTNVPAGLTDVTAVDAGQHHSLALKSDGTVVAWGNHDFGQSTVPEGLTDVTAVDAGAWHNLAIRSSTSADNMPPVVSVSRSDEPNAAGWNNQQQVVVTISAVDEPDDSGVSSGVEFISFSAIGAHRETADVNGDTATVSISEEGTTEIIYSATDNSGIQSKILTISVKLDNTPPVLQQATVEDVWHNQDVSVPFTASDELSGLANTADQSFALSTSVAEGTETDTAHTDTRIISDLAGNEVTAGPITGLKVDKAAPDIIIVTPPEGATYLLNQQQPVIADYSATDGGSGLAEDSPAGPVSSGAAINTATVGDNTFTVTATDNVGNQATLTRNYQVIFDFGGDGSTGDGGGFLQPVEDNAYNEVKAGAIVPVKFSFGGYYGDASAIFYAGYPISRKIDYETGEPVIPIDEGATQSNAAGLRYDDTTDQYIYSWRTNRAWSDTCRQLVFKFADGTEHVVNFKFR